MKTRAVSVDGLGVKLLLGALFVFSSLAKFISIEKFSVYIFSFGFLSMNLSIVAAWFVISFEMLLGIAMISNRYHKKVMLVNLLLLLFFTLFLAFAHLSGRTDSCHCLGDLLPFNPLQSILKNTILILLSLFAWKWAPCEKTTPWYGALPFVLLPAIALFFCGRLGWMPMTVIDFVYAMVLAFCGLAMALVLSFRWGKKHWVQLLVALTPFVAVMILSTWVSLFAPKGDTLFNKDYFTQILLHDDQLQRIRENKDAQVVAFFSPSCPYCRLAAEKLTLIQHRHNLPPDNITIVFPGDSIVPHPDFFQAANADPYTQCALNVNSFLKLTYGQLPVVALVDNGTVVATYTHSDISESQIKKFLQ